MTTEAPLKLFMVAGEPSGDLHAANLAREIQRLAPGSEIHGLGGPQMRAAGVTVHFDLVDLAIMWFRRVTASLHIIRQALRDALDWVDANQPDAVILVDYPGFNLALARFLRKRRVTVIYYMAPQLWAWGGWRIRKMRKRVSHILAALPFEEAYFGSRGMPTTYVGHPIFDFLRSVEVKATVREELGIPAEESLLALLPGSRKQEIEGLMPVMSRTLRAIRRRHPGVRAVAATPKEEYRDLILSIAQSFGEKIDVLVGRSLDLIASADAVFTASGTATLEIMHFRKPMVVVYRATPINRLLSVAFMTSPFIALVNLLAEREIVPEMLLTLDRSEALASTVERTLYDEPTRERITRDLDALATRLEVPGATEHAAREAIRLAREKPLPPGTPPA